jgi:hypothetical protein
VAQVAAGTYEGIAHLARTFQYGAAERDQLRGGQQARNWISDPFFYWDDTADNTVNEKVVAEAKAQYGAAPVDLILEIRSLQAEGDPAPFATVSAKYWNDPEKAAVIRSLSERQFGDPERQAEAEKWLHLADVLDTASTGDLGAMLTTTNPFSGKPVSVDSSWRGSIPQQALSKTTNVAATFLLDPLIWGAKGRAVFLTAKYGLERLAVDAGADVATNVLAKPQVYRYLQDLTKDLATYSSKRAAGEDTSSFMASVAQRYARYFPEDMLMDLANAGVHTPELFVKYVDDTNRMLRIERGEAIAAAAPDAARGDLRVALVNAQTADEVNAAAREAIRQGVPEETVAKIVTDVQDKSLYGRMVRQQSGRRGEPLVPRNSFLPATELRRTISRAVQRAKPDTQSRKAVRAFYEDVNNPDIPAGQILFNDPKGVAAFDQTVSNGWDRLTRWVATTPGKQAIYTLDARDTKVFYKFARLFMSKPHAQYLAERWRNADQSQRILMWVGVVRSAGERRGVQDMIDQGRTAYLGTRLIKGQNEVPVGDLFDILSFSRDPRALFAPDSMAIQGADGAVTDVEKWVDDEVARWVEGQAGYAGLRDRSDALAAARAAIQSDTASADYVFHTSPEIDGIIRDGLRAGDVAGVPMLEQGYGDVVHVFRKADMAGDSPRPVASFTYDELGLKYDDLEIGSRAAETGTFPGESGLPWDSPATATTDAAQVRNRIQAAYAARDSSPSQAEIDAYRESLLADNPELFDQVIRSSPSDFDGKQLALHLWQTSDYLAVPNLSDIAMITKRSKAMNQILGLTPGSFGSEFVNWWSLLNLAGFRYSTRNAIEDWTMYALTTGHLKNIAQGRAVSTAVRESRGQNIGWFARKMRRAAGQAPADGDPYPFFQHFVLPQLNKEEVAAAHAAMEDGNLEVFRDLVVKAAVRQKLGRTLSDDEQRFISEYVASDAAFNELDSVTELARDMNLGVMPGNHADLRNPVSDGHTVRYERAGFAGVSMTSNNFKRFTYWHRSLQGILNGDGAMGRAAVAHLDDPQKAIDEVARIIAEDVEYGYKERLAAFYEAGATPQEFATRYVQDVLNSFSKADGSLNRPLWQRFVRETPAGRSVKWADNVDGQWQPRVSVADLRGIGEVSEDMLPKTILGREAGGSVIIPDRVSERIWNAMGNAVARVSREPIYFGNYIAARNQLKGYEASLAEAISPKAAGIAADKIAKDRAMMVTLAYTDNPANQTMLAWRMRNFARYYRATEDFYRRMYRMAKFHPMGFYKGWLALNALDETGFIYNDSYGDKYFLYPGDQLTNGLLGQVLGTVIPGEASMFTAGMPTTFGGKVKMLAPSFDPNAALPQMSSPLAALSVNAIMQFVPQFRQYEQWILGRYATDQGLAQQLIPQPFLKGIQMLTKDDRDSAYSAAFIAATRVAAGAGQLPGLDATEQEQADAANGIANLATQILQTRWALGLLVPASPQVLPNDVTAWARSVSGVDPSSGVTTGVDGMSKIYRDLVNEEIRLGSKNPYDTAMMKGVAIYGLSFTAYGQGASGQGLDLKSVPAYSYSSKVTDWAKANGDVLRDHPSAAMFLGPVKTEADDFSSDTYKWLIDNGYKTAPSASDYLKRVLDAEAQYVKGATQDDIDAALAAAPDEAARKQVEAAKKQAFIAFDRIYPGYRDRSNAEWLGHSAQIEMMLDGGPGGQGEARKMIDDYYAGKYGPIPKSVESIAQAVATYDYYNGANVQITGQTKAERDARKANRLAMLVGLREIAASNPNAELFIQRVLYPRANVRARADGTPRD